MEKKESRFCYTERQWNKIMQSITTAGFKNKSSFIRKRINDIHIAVSVTNEEDLTATKKYSVFLDDSTKAKALEISKRTKKPVDCIIKHLILDPLLHQ